MRSEEVICAIMDLISFVQIALSSRWACVDFPTDFLPVFTFVLQFAAIQVV